ncbi:MAG: hypothetical protein DWQ07_11595 [Chloroflexi bacterium]|nr:MAG: hypothetical protein DWQ07_11595 [Chloroflexota bacterium]MBL1197151.1 hypothetical protein [Chloroflexota bacterium]
MSSEAIPVKLPSRIFRVRSGRDQVAVTIRRRINPWQFSPIIVGLLAWAYVVIYLFGVNLPFVDEVLSPLRGSPEAGFILVSLAWVMGMAFYALVALRQYGIRETIRFNSRGIRLHHAFTMLSWSRFYKADKVADIRVAKLADREYGEAPQFEKSLTMLVFDHDFKMILCGEGLTAEQAEDILTEVKNSFPQYVK